MRDDVGLSNRHGSRREQKRYICIDQFSTSPHCHVIFISCDYSRPFKLKSDLPRLHLDFYAHRLKDHYDASEDTYHQAMSRFKCIGCARAYSKAKELSNHRRNCKAIDAQRSLILKNLQEKIARASNAQQQAEQSEPGMDEEEMMEGFPDEFPADTMEVEVRYQYLVS